MQNFNEFFKRQGSIYLQNISYKLISLEMNPEQTKTDVIDHISTELISDYKELRVLFTRTIKFNPERLYELSITYGAIYTFNEGYSKELLENINFDNLILRSNNIMFTNIISRTSLLISQITSSHGQFPMVTPPLFLIEH